MGWRVDAESEGEKWGGAEDSPMASLWLPEQTNQVNIGAGIHTIKRILYDYSSDDARDLRGKCLGFAWD
jgi:hypothetical protein